jgi:hypothetical protein
MKRSPLWLADALANATLFFGRHWQTISARAGYAAYRDKSWGRWAAPLIDALFGKGHCRAQAVREGLITDA